MINLENTEDNKEKKRRYNIRVHSGLECAFNCMKWNMDKGAQNTVITLGDKQVWEQGKKAKWYRKIPKDLKEGDIIRISCFSGKTRDFGDYKFLGLMNSRMVWETVQTKRSPGNLLKKQLRLSRVRKNIIELNQELKLLEWEIKELEEC